jgi:hypothetical protein
MDWRRVRQVRRVYLEFFIPPPDPILVCRIESGLRVNSEGVLIAPGAAGWLCNGWQGLLEWVAGFAWNTHLYWYFTLWNELSPRLLGANQPPDDHPKQGKQQDNQDPQ